MQQTLLTDCFGSKTAAHFNFRRHRMQKTRPDGCLNRVKHWQLQTNDKSVRLVLQRDQ